MRICIDAGHNDSDFDTGAVGNGLREQDISFEIGTKLSKLLRQNNFEVIETRPKKFLNLGNSVNSSITKRVEISNLNQCDLFISIHCNAGGGIGTETLIYKSGGEAEKLARLVQNKIVSSLNTISRGVKEKNIGVLRLTNCPAILVETAFIDSKSDSILLKIKQNEFADAICSGILKYLEGDENQELSLGEIKTFLAEKWKLTNPTEVFMLLDNHPHKNELYKKIFSSYTNIN
jgi:N-acetylmuramoyl-L-alanine amidase